MTRGRANFKIQDDPPTHKGWLRKKRRRMGGWAKRWVELQWEEIGGYAVLVYGDTEGAAHRDNSNVISLKHCFVQARPELDDMRAHGGSAWCFELMLSHSPHPDQRDYLWWAGSDDARTEWIRVITKAALHSNVDNGYLIQRESMTAKLGTGAFSQVWKGKERESGQEWALKEIVKSDLNFDEEMSLREEIRILGLVGEHPNIVYLHEFIETDVHYYVVMEYLCGGALLDLIMHTQSHHFSEQDAVDIMKQLMKAIDFLHSYFVVHRDLKPENFLLAGASADPTRKFQHRVVLADFGCATQLQKEDELLHDITGSPGYVAPEVLMGKDGPGYGVPSDVWSMGVILYILLTGICPFAADDDEHSFARTLKGEFEWNLLEGVSVTGRDLISNMLQKPPSKRLTAQQVLCHPWMQGEGVGTLDLRIADNVRQLKSNFRAKGYRARDAAYKAYDGVQGLVAKSLSSAAGLLDRVGLRRASQEGRTSQEGRRSQEGNDSFAATGSGASSGSSPLKGTVR